MKFVQENTGAPQVAPQEIQAAAGRLKELLENALSVSQGLVRASDVAADSKFRKLGG